jgi:hypothetical protein
MEYGRNDRKGDSNDLHSFSAWLAPSGAEPRAKSKPCQPSVEDEMRREVPIGTAPPFHVRHCTGYEQLAELSFGEVS